MNIALPEKLSQQLQERVSASKEFNSVEEYVVYVLNTVLQQTASPSAPPPSGAPSSAPDTGYSKEQEEEVKRRLHDLGYLD